MVPLQEQERAAKAPRCEKAAREALGSAEALEGMLSSCKASLRVGIPQPALEALQVNPNPPPLWVQGSEGAPGCPLPGPAWRWGECCRPQPTGSHPRMLRRQQGHGEGGAASHRRLLEVGVLGLGWSAQPAREGLALLGGAEGDCPIRGRSLRRADPHSRWQPTPGPEGDDAPAGGAREGEPKRDRPPPAQIAWQRPCEEEGGCDAPRAGEPPSGAGYRGALGRPAGAEPPWAGPASRVWPAAAAAALGTRPPSPRPALPGQIRASSARGGRDAVRLRGPRSSSSSLRPGLPPRWEWLLGPPPSLPPSLWGS